MVMRTSSLIVVPARAWASMADVQAEHALPRDLLGGPLTQLPALLVGEQSRPCLRIEQHPDRPTPVYLADVVVAVVHRHLPLAVDTPGQRAAAQVLQHPREIPVLGL